MDSVNDSVSSATATREAADETRLRPNLGMKLLVFFVLLIGGFLIVDLLQAWMRF